MSRKTLMTLVSLALASVLALALCGCTATQNQTSEETTSEFEPQVATSETSAEEPTASAPETPQLISVSVVDKTRESIPGASFEDYWLETDYEYDDAGRLIETSQSTDYTSKTPLNLGKATFEYDDAGRLAKVSNAYEQYEWHVGNVETFSYDAQGLCVEHTYDVVSQGYGGTTMMYSYDGGRIARAVESDRGRPNIDPTTFDLSWTYLDDGRIAKVISGAGGEAGFGLVDELSDPAQGTYVYRDVYDGLNTLKYNADGTLASVTTRTANGKYQTQKTYEYKTITVAASEYLPTVYSNPTGLDPKWKPQITLDEVPHTLME